MTMRHKSSTALDRRFWPESLPMDGNGEGLVAPMPGHLRAEMAGCDIGGGLPAADRPGRERAVMRRLGKLDLHIQPGFQDGWSRAPIEATSRDVPIRGSACGGIPEPLPPECRHRSGNRKTLAERSTGMGLDSERCIHRAKRYFRAARPCGPGMPEARRGAFGLRFAETFGRTVRVSA